jgi:hypothetical protein
VAGLCDLLRVCSGCCGGVTAFVLVYTDAGFAKTRFSLNIEQLKHVLRAAAGITGETSFVLMAHHE